MRNTALILISALIVPALLADKGKNYTKENVCQELKAIGGEKFKEMVTVLYSQKFPNGTFEEVNCVADEMTKLAEKCCKDDASPDCYDKGLISQYIQHLAQVKKLSVIKTIIFSIFKINILIADSFFTRSTINKYE